MRSLDEQIRLRAFGWLSDQQAIHGDVLPRSLLQQGFEVDGERVPLLGPQGIFKPRLLDLPLSITTAPHGPYNDSFSMDGFLLYRYRGTDPSHRDNVGLRKAFSTGTPLIYFHGLVRGRYMATWPVFIVGDDPASLTFKVAVDDVGVLPATLGTPVVAEGRDARRAYITTMARRRLHQRSFRERVLHAYRERCALCRLGHHELLDAAHIIPDREPEGMPTVRNGVSLCKLHHAAFDSLLLAITPDYQVEIRRDLLEEHDGPMLQHGLKEMHERNIILPSDRDDWPDPDALDARYQRFKLAS